jgi:hypothetical protein
MDFDAVLKDKAALQRIKNAPVREAKFRGIRQGGEHMM